jgi:Fic family protein
MVRHQPRNRVTRNRNLQPSHRPAASRALIHVGLEHVLEQPPPALAARRWRVVAQAANKNLDVDLWLGWFADAVLEAQAHTLRAIEFVLEKTKLLDRLRGQLNERQEKALLRMLAEGPDGFEGGLSAAKYRSLTGAPAATATRDLSQLVELRALRKTGQPKSTRYWLPFAELPGQAR